VLSRFPVAFRPPAFASRVIPIPPGELGLPHSRLTARRHGGGPRRGYHLPPSRATTGLGALSPPGTGGAHRTGCRARPAPAASQRHVPTPRHHIPPRGATIHEASMKVHAIHPSGLPLARDPHSGMEILRLSLGLRTPPSPATHAKDGARQRARTRDYRTDITSASSLRVHSQRATSCRNGK
jgi:hypothetical protein